MSRIEKLLPDYYKELHEREAFKGDTWQAYLAEFADWAGLGSHHDDPEEKLRLNRHAMPVLDFGCGPKGGVASVMAAGEVLAYDPYVPAYAETPWDKKWRSFFSADVFEHLTTSQLADVLRHVEDNRECLAAYLAISTRHAGKTFPNGLNVHLTVKPPEWWVAFCSVQLPHYALELAAADLLGGTLRLGFRRKP